MGHIWLHHHKINFAAGRWPWASYNQSGRNLTHNLAIRAAAKEAKSTKVLLEEESEQIDDDWLDDEQWYSEHAAK